MLSLLLILFKSLSTPYHLCSLLHYIPFFFSFTSCTSFFLSFFRSIFFPFNPFLLSLFSIFSPLFNSIIVSFLSTNHPLSNHISHSFTFFLLTLHLYFVFPFLNYLIFLCASFHSSHLIFTRLCLPSLTSYLFHYPLAFFSFSSPPFHEDHNYSFSDLSHSLSLYSPCSSRYFLPLSFSCSFSFSSFSFSL